LGQREELRVRGPPFEIVDNLKQDRTESEKKNILRKRGIE
jgi:hypothetical protein